MSTQPGARAETRIFLADVDGLHPGLCYTTERTARVSRIVQALVVAAAAVLGGVVLGLGRGWPEVTAQAAVTGQDVAVCEAAAEPGSPEIRWISQQEARALVGSPRVAFVDCRSSRDLFEAGHIAGSVHVPAEDGTPSKQDIEALRGSSTIITYCDAGSSCERSVRLASIFMQAGLSDVRVLEGGMPVWLANGFPAESGTCRLCDGHGPSE